MKKTVIRIIVGLLVSVAIMALLFYFFLFANPVGIHEANRLKWIPIIIITISIYSSGVINKNTPTKWLPFLLLPLVFLKPFNYFYFPFIVIALLVAILMLVASRKTMKFKKVAWTTSVTIFLFFLFNQALIIENQGFGYDEQGELINTTTLWNLSKSETKKIPKLIWETTDGNDFNISSMQDKTYFITFWATWCAPCMEEKPALEKLKQDLRDNNDIEFIDVSFDRNTHIWKEYLSEYQPKGIQLYTENSQLTNRKLDFAGIPMHIILDKTGAYKRYRSFEVARNIIKLKTN